MTEKKKIMAVFGTRPEAIKLAPVIKELNSLKKNFEVIVCVTGQHREMLDQVLKLFKIKPDHDLKIMSERQTISSIVTKTLTGLDKILKKDKPDLIMVQGDTSTAFASSLSAFYSRIPLAHVEAGLRSYKKDNPFPEEMNRRLTGILADIHFAPTFLACENLLKEGVDRSEIYVTGNTVIDALRIIVEKKFDLKKFGIKLDPSKKLIVVTAHRRESFGPELKSICEAIKVITKNHSDEIQVVIPVHKNPIVRTTINSMLSKIPQIKLLEPLDYEPFVHLMKEAHIVLTDSGGIQEEAPYLGKPVLVMRTNTERPEAIMAKTVKLVGTKAEDIIREAEKLLTNEEEYKKMSRAINPYGDGFAAKRIANALLHYFSFIEKKPEEFGIAKSLQRDYYKMDSRRPMHFGM